MLKEVVLRETRTGKNAEFTGKKLLYSRITTFQTDAARISDIRLRNVILENCKNFNKLSVSWSKSVMKSA
jgi:hypothetical protein